MTIVGARFGRLVVTGPAEPKHRAKRWTCACDCGEVREVFGYSLTSGCTKSCGCLARECTPPLRTTHGRTHSPEHEVWMAMRSRCRGPKIRNYGGRGVTVCPEWESFEVFLRDMGERPGPGYSIDRVDGAKGYSKDNCRWATRKEQNNNTSRNRFLTYQGETKTITQWAEARGVRAEMLRKRLALGWSVERTLEAPVMTQYIRDAS